MKLFKLLFSRLGITLMLVVLEIVYFISLLQWLSPYIGWVTGVLQVASVFIILWIINRSRHLSADMMWIVLIFLAPIPGTIVYAMLSTIGKFPSRTYRNIMAETQNCQYLFEQDEEVLEEACDSAGPYAGQINYISQTAGFPVYRNEGFDYYSSGEEAYPLMLHELRAAKEFIFIEYFIIKEGRMWNGILNILRDKAAQGVDVRVIYDDFGSISTLPYRYADNLEKNGIKTISFNRVNPFLNGIQNHRDHRKILVVDGRVAFTGGINLADEYINLKERFGYWKDNVVRVKGDAVWSFTLMFLTMWNALRKEDDDFSLFRSDEEIASVNPADGWIAPYGETPLDDVNVGQNIYENILNQAKDYCYIFTPYLIIDTDMINALIMAANRGVDVRIITPGIPDKKLIYNITRSFYNQLILGGVKIYEYTPGFIHSKVFVCDDRIATVGTLNLDYRSLYLHFENGIYLCDSADVLTVKQDVIDTLNVSHHVSLEESRHNLLHTLIFSIVRIFAPLM
ncbi:MAG: cardiolipin synthase [Oscillospiraceae bacterium]|nr:cardiolipin synthase [Oscillospiraceae bacterium]